MPLVSDAWPGFRVVGLLGVVAPANTPPDVARRLNVEFNAALKDPKVRDFLVARGSTIEDDGPPEKLARTLADRLAHYRRLAQAMNIKPQ